VARRSIGAVPSSAAAASASVALARRAGAGDHDAFAVLYARYAPRLEAYCRSIVRHDEDARDALQAAMTNAFVALRRRGGGGELVVRPWLYRIAHNEAVNVLRRRRPAAELSEHVPDAALEPPAQALLREELGATVASIRALPDRLAHPLLLRELSGLSYGEVATVLGTSPEVVRKAVFEARLALAADRAALDEDCATIRETLSGGDGRRRRARRMRSHLRVCAACRDWDRAERERRRRLAAFPIAGASAWAWLAGVLGLGGGGAAAPALSGAIPASVKAAAAVGAIVVAPVAVEVEPPPAASPAHTAGAPPASPRPARTRTSAAGAPARPGAVTPTHPSLTSARPAPRGASPATPSRARAATAPPAARRAAAPPGAASIRGRISGASGARDAAAPNETTGAGGAEAPGGRVG
jgi:RNA polymerase sigma factor (sigma-70 family)